jgi:copper(I)-binding protein
MDMMAIVMISVGKFTARNSLMALITISAVIMTSDRCYSFNPRFIIEDAIIHLDPRDQSRGKLNLVFHNTTPLSASITGINSQFISDWKILCPRKSTDNASNIHVPANATLFMKDDTPHFLLYGVSPPKNSENKLQLNLVINNDRQIPITAKIITDSFDSSSINQRR